MAMIFGFLGRGFGRFGAAGANRRDPHPGDNLLLRDGVFNILLRDGTSAILLGH